MKRGRLLGCLAVLFVSLVGETLLSCHRLKPVIEKDDAYIKSETYSGDLSSLTCGEVIRVIDGDTFVCDIDNKQTTIRLIGIDTPESVHSDKEKNTPEGKQVAEFMTDLLGDQTVYIEYDVSSTDYYGRHLAYVYLSDGRMVQDILLENGLARIMTIQPNSKYAEHFKRIEKTARKAQVGFWVGVFE